MSKQNSNEILKKYKDGLTSLEEESFLLNNKDEVSSEFGLLASFLKKNKQKIPKNLNEKLWTSFDKKTKTKKNFKFSILSAAASIIFLISIFLYKNNQNTLSDKEKAALLKEAKSMFVNTNEQEEMYTKILENDLVVVYLKAEKN